MDLLLYSSKEMFSSSKLDEGGVEILDKISNKEIDKAVILKDAKPSHLILDFEVYESLMKDYTNLKKAMGDESVTITSSSNEDVVQKRVERVETQSDEELNQKELEKALKEIESLDLSVVKREEEKKEESTPKEKESAESYLERRRRERQEKKEKKLQEMENQKLEDYWN